MTLEVWDAERLRAGLAPGDAVAALHRRLLTDPPPADRPRRGRHDLVGGHLLLMPDESRSYAGVKVASLSRGNPARGLPTVQGVYVLMDATTLSPLVVLDAAELTLLRTSALTALAVSALVPVVPARITVIGSGPQAVAHAASLATLASAAVRVVVRSAPSAARVRAEAAARGVTVEVTEDLDVAGSDVVVCATSSRVPLFDSSAVGDAAVVVAIGSHEPDVRELDTALLARGFVVVESRVTARREAGDVVIAETETSSAVIDAELLDVLSGAVAVDVGRPRVFKSVGESWEDLTVAAALWEGRSTGL